MQRALTAERVCGDVEVLARAGLDLVTFLAEAEASMTRALQSSATCVATLDPATSLLTSTYKFGDLAGRDEHDLEWSLIEFGGDEPTAFRELGTPAIGMHLATAGDLERSTRMRECIQPFYGYGDELRLVAEVDGRRWGALAFFRSPDDAPFDADDVAFAGSLSATLARGFRSGILTSTATAAVSGTRVGPAVIIVDAGNQLVQVSAGARSRLAEVVDTEHSAATTGTTAALVAAARRYAAGITDVLPRGRLRLASGQWVVLQASPMDGPAGTTGDVCITIEDARPPEIVPLVVEAFDLTTRERDVTQLVLQGAETKEIATALHLSAYTVQDHLKSVFDKADVRSRRELIAKVFFDQYQPRFQRDLAPDGWFSTTASPEEW